MDERIDLSRARRDAKALLRAARAGEVVLRPDRAPVLADAQRAVAEELGYPSWPALVSEVRGSALLAAASEGRASDAYRLLVDGAPPNARDGAGRTALHLAAAGGHVDVVSVLVGWVTVDRSAVDAAGRGASSDDPVVARILAPREPPADDAALGSLACDAEAAWFAFVAGSPLASRRAVGDGFAFRTGLWDNTRNGVVCSRADDVAGTIAWIGGAPAQWLVGADSALGPALEAAGCRPERTAVFMARDAGTDAVRGADAGPVGDAVRGADAVRLGDAGPGGDIVPIADAPALRAAMAAAEALDEDPREAALLASLGFDGPLRHYAARRDGAPVGIVSTFAWRETVTLTQLAVAPAWRRQGIGRALVQHVARGLTLLGPTPATVPFYEALGFRLLRVPADRAFYLPG
jgi:GNAT superfamily N-acetyltransferase